MGNESLTPTLLLRRIRAAIMEHHAAMLKYHTEMRNLRIAVLKILERLIANSPSPPI